MKGLNHVKASFIPILIVLFALVSNIQTLAVVSPANQFNATPSPVFVNWTAGIVNITSNTANLSINISNASTFISGNFSQAIRWSAGEYPALTAAAQANCFDAMDVKTAEGGTDFRNTTAGQLPSGNSTNFTIEAYPTCPPGRYEGTIAFFNSTNSTESISIYAIVNIPVSASNSFNSSFNNASFKGKTNAGTLSAQSFFFNTSLAQNLTGFSISLTGLGGDVDVFLLDAVGTTVAKSLNTSSNDEDLIYTNFQTIPTNQIWEIRVFGNVTANYTGSLQFSPINFTNFTSSSSLANSIDYGLVSPNSTGSINFTIENEHSNKVNVSQAKVEVYRLERFNNSATNNFTIIVPNFAEKVEAEIAWQPTSLQTDWDLLLYDRSSRIVASSTTKLNISNVTNTTRFEKAAYTIINTTNQGFWTVSVFNQTGGSNPYNLTVKTYFQSSVWLNTNFGPTFEFNQTNGINSTKNVTVNLTVPVRSLINGTYEAKITYTGTARTQLTALFNVMAGSLIINNTLAANSSVNLTENIGYNRSLVLNISYNNTGDYPVYWSNLSSPALYLETNGSRFINFSVVTWPPNPIPAGSGGRLTVNITINVNNTVNAQGIYSGWIYFNTTNSTATSSSYPLETHNLTLNINLTDQLISRNVAFTTFTFVNGSKQNNMTVNFTLLLQNGTAISVDGQFNLSNIRNTYIREKDVGYYTKEITAFANISNPMCSTISPFSCMINMSIPANTAGGFYSPEINVTFTTPDGSTLQTLITQSNTTDAQELNNTGLNLSASTSVSLGNINEGVGTTTFNVTVQNWGGTGAYGMQLAFNTNSCAAITVVANDTNCLGGTNRSSATFITDNLTAYHSPSKNGCWFKWNITATNVTSTTTCSNMSVTTSNLSYNNITGISITVTETSTSSDTSTSSSSGGGSGSGSKNSSSTASSGKALTITEFQSSVYVLHNSTNVTAVKVKNTGDIGLEAIFEITDLNVSVKRFLKPDGKLTLNASNEVTYNLTFDATGDVDVGEYSGKLKASSGDIADTKDFKVIVLPTESKKAEINMTYKLYEEAITNLTKRLAELKAKGCFSFINVTQAIKSVKENVTGNQTPKMINVTEEIKTNITANITVEQIEAKIKEMNNSLATAKSLMAESKFIEAKKELDSIRDKVPSAQNSLNDLEAFQQICFRGRGFQLPDTGLIMAAIIAILAGSLIYFYKPRGFRKAKGWVKPLNFKPHMVIGDLFIKLGTKIEGKNLKHKIKTKVKRRKGFRFK